MTSIDTTAFAQFDAANLLLEATTPAPASIRSIIRAGLLARKSTQEIAAEVKEAHPNSAAATKSVKHIGFYRCQMRKAGELPAFKR